MVQSLKRWGVKVTSTADRRGSTRPIYVRRTFTKLGAAIQERRLNHSLNGDHDELQFKAEKARA